MLLLRTSETSSDPTLRSTAVKELAADADFHHFPPKKTKTMTVNATPKLLKAPVNLLILNK